MTGADEDAAKQASAMLEAPAKKAAIGSLGVAAAVGAVKHHGIVRVHDACVLLWGVDWVCS